MPNGFPARLLAAAAVATVMFASLPPFPALAGGAGHCPPGLAKKGSCIPPGQQNKWSKGDRVPDYVDYRVIVRYGDYRLPPPGRGQVYIETGREIYLIAEATKRIIEAVNLIERAAN